MWGEHAVGKLVKGPEPLKPQVQPSSMKRPATRCARRSPRRLQHFIDRRVAAAMEPLLALGRDETLDGQAKGFAYRMVGAVRRHPARRGGGRGQGAGPGGARRAAQAWRPLRPVHRLPAGAAEAGADAAAAGPVGPARRASTNSPRARRPGLVTLPAPKGAEPGYFAMAGYRAAGERAIRIDMLERLADMLRDKDSRGGFEASPDMLSITGLTLEQFAALMEGLGYKAEQGERPKLRPAEKRRTPQPDPPDRARRAGAGTVARSAGHAARDARSGRARPAAARHDARGARRPGAPTRRRPAPTCPTETPGSRTCRRPIRPRQPRPSRPGAVRADRGAAGGSARDARRRSGRDAARRVPARCRRRPPSEASVAEASVDADRPSTETEASTPSPGRAARAPQGASPRRAGARAPREGGRRRRAESRSGKPGKARSRSASRPRRRREAAREEDRPRQPFAAALAGFKPK